MIPTLNLLVKMVDVFPNCGCVTLTMIVVMIQTSQHICVDSEIVRQDGNVVLVKVIIVAFPSGCSVMAKMIVEMDLMNYLNIVQNVLLKPTSNVAIIDVFQSE